MQRTRLFFNWLASGRHMTGIWPYIIRGRQNWFIFFVLLSIFTYAIMKKPFILLIAFGYCFIFLFTITIAKEHQQTVLNQPEIAIQNEVFQLSDELFETESIITSCSSCISLLHVLKKISYMSEAFLINTLTKACKRTKKVDDEVVRQKKMLHPSTRLILSMK
jgi:hypothetical protein